MRPRIGITLAGLRWDRSGGRRPGDLGMALQSGTEAESISRRCQQKGDTSRERARALIHLSFPVWQRRDSVFKSVARSCRVAIHGNGF